jgi:excinuclease ABC subunit C
MVTRLARIEAVTCDSEHEAAWLERNLLEQSLPRWNKTPGGQEVPVYIRLDLEPASPGISVVHSLKEASVGQARHFGPYLGGGRVRLAVDGLHRVMPLAYTGDRRGGFNHDMARVRGVGPATRVTLGDAITAVLERDPAAVASLRAELTRRRDSAAQSLDFERAAQVQAEIEAVEWVVSAQKATVCDPDDVEVCGWAGGLLVQFEVRAGRLCVWQQRVCAEAAARPRVAATPVAWAEFAQRNAELAARLAQ